jgi:hypothetical protein
MYRYVEKYMIKRMEDDRGGLIRKKQSGEKQNREK